MPLEKYEHIEDYYNRRLQENNGDQRQTLIDCLSYGFYERQDTIDTPQDINLENTDNTNYQFILSKIIVYLEEFKNRAITTETKHNEDSNTYSTLIDIINNTIDMLYLRVQGLVKIDGTSQMTEDLEMGDHRVTNLKDAIDDKDAVNKESLFKLINNVILNITPDIDKYIRTDGTIPMTEDLDTDNHKVVNLKDATESSDAVNLSKLNQMIDAYLASGNNKFIKKDGSVSMQGTLNTGWEHKIITVANPQNDTDLSNLEYALTPDRTDFRDPISKPDLSEIEAISDPQHGKIVRAEDTKMFYTYDSTSGLWFAMGNPPLQRLFKSFDASVSSTTISSLGYTIDFGSNSKIFGYTIDFDRILLDVIVTSGLAIVSFSLFVNLSNFDSSSDVWGAIDFDINFSWDKFLNDHIEPFVVANYRIIDLNACIEAHLNAREDDFSDQGDVRYRNLFSVENVFNPLKPNNFYNPVSMAFSNRNQQNASLSDVSSSLRVTGEITIQLETQRRL